MKADIYPIREFEGLALSIMPRPRAGDWLEDEIAEWKRFGINAIVSLLEPAEVAELGLTREAGLCADSGMVFHSYPIPDRGVPAATASFDAFLDPLVSSLRAGSAVAVHCRAGIGRSGLTAACMLIRAGVPYPLVFPAISRARGVKTPDTDIQESWVRTYSSSLSRC